VTVSATECAASESIAAEPLTSAPTAFATAIAKFTAAATRTVIVLSAVGSPPAPGVSGGVSASVTAP
jgi:hypothetical protein